MTRFFLTISCALAAQSLGLFLAPAMALADSDELPMQFEQRQEGPAELCAPNCRHWISASGAITADTPEHLRAFAKGKDVRGATLALDSNGGSVLGALALGREIRRLQLNTTVGRTVADAARVSLDPHADCESMCAFVLMAGVRRSVPEEARVLVHQIWLGDRRDDPTAGSYTAEDLVLVQRDIGRIAQYTVEIGASAELLDIALRIPPWEPMRLLTRDELNRLDVLTVDDPSARAAPAPAEAAGPALTAVSIASAARASQRAWQLVNRAGTPGMVRRHPLTVEGEAIGSFDLTLACGATSDSYVVQYAEQRQGPKSALQRISLWVGEESVPLSVVSSHAMSDGDSLETVASGNVSLALIKKLAALHSRSLTIATASKGMETSIRVGNTGIAQNFAAFAAGCENRGSRKADAAGPTTGVLAHAN